APKVRRYTHLFFCKKRMNCLGCISRILAASVNPKSPSVRCKLSKAIAFGFNSLNEELIFPPYNPIQIDAVKELTLNIFQRYPDIMPTYIVGHSDIAIGRKSDPEAAFPWKELYMAGIGAWYDDEPKNHYQEQFSKNFPSQKKVLSKLKCYGYDISSVCIETGYKDLIRAFQLHFRQENYNGILDVEIAAILYILIDKYFP
ncbi:hypothetical protein MCY_01665, partial [Bartonella rattimassiliensis 15908]